MRTRKKAVKTFVLGAHFAFGCSQTLPVLTTEALSRICCRCSTFSTHRRTLGSSQKLPWLKMTNLDLIPLSAAFLYREHPLWLFAFSLFDNIAPFEGQRAGHERFFKSF